MSSVLCLLTTGCGGGGGNGTTQTLTTITISPTSVTVVSGAMQTFTVKGYDQNGAEMSFTPAFTVTPSELGIVTISGQNGVFTAVKKGTGTIKVTGGNNITATSSITVTTGPLNSLVISPTEVTLSKGETQQFTVYGVDAEGNAKQRKYITVSPTWSVIGGIGTIDGNGLFTATIQGTGQVKAEAQKDDSTTTSITADVTVANQNPVISSLTANPTSINTGETSTITCTASDADGDTLTYSWTKTGGTITGSGSSVTYTSDTEETYAITVTVSDGKGGSATNSVDITVTAPSQETWQKTYGGSDEDWAYSIQQTSDGGYIVAGCTCSFGAGSGDFYIIKLDASGNKVWEKTYGGSKWDWAYSIQQTSDGGYIVAGGRPDGRFNTCYIIKLNPSGDKVWEKTYTETIYDEVARSIQQTSDGGYIVAGETQTMCVTRGACYILKLDSSGNRVWEKTYGGPYGDGAESIQQTSDGGYIAAGWTYSPDAKRDLYVIKLDAGGNTGPYPGDVTKIKGVSKMREEPFDRFFDKLKN